ncbi:MAG: hypothetical protein H0S79_05050 [Anaerolineaceae bacterium]|nr:hypothetical protein [Anaerolineaceae bacterium]
MKRLNIFLVLLVLILSSLACSFPWETPTETPPSVPTTEVPALPSETEAPIETEPPTEEVVPSATAYTCPAGLTGMTAFSVEFCYPFSLATGVAQSMIPENPPDPMSAPWDYNPDMIELTLQDYPVYNQYHAPIIHIYPVADYIALEPNIQTTLTSLQTLLASQDPHPSSVPFLPIFNAAQMMHAQVTYLTFRNGHGVRFLTQYGQAALPINNPSTIYAFMGLTDDGQYFISATFGINHPSFENDSMAEPAEGWEAFTNNYETYITNMETALAAEPANAFTPDLSLLDGMMSSFLVPAAAIP